MGMLNLPPMAKPETSQWEHVSHISWGEVWISLKHCWVCSGYPRIVFGTWAEKLLLDQSFISEGHGFVNTKFLCRWLFRCPFGIGCIPPRLTPRGLNRSLWSLMRASSQWFGWVATWQEYGWLSWLHQQTYGNIKNISPKSKP